VPVEDKDAARPEREEALDKSSPATADEMYIPDYVMLHFGVPLQLKPAGGHPSNSVGLE
jgi:hypothetical protein